MENKVNKEDAKKFLKETGYEFDSYIMAVVEKMLFNFAEQQVKIHCSYRNVINWVAISKTESPNRLSDVLARLGDGTEIKLEFDTDGRFYDDAGEDFTDEISEWKQL